MTMDQRRGPSSQNGNTCKTIYKEVGNSHEFTDKSISKGSIASKSKEDKKEIYTYESPWTIYAMSLSGALDPMSSSNFRVALGSFEVNSENKIEVLERDGETGEFTSMASFPHDYPATNIKWCPKIGYSTGLAGKDLIASTGDILRLWSVSSELCDMKRENKEKSNHYGKQSNESMVKNCQKTSQDEMKLHNFQPVASLSLKHANEIDAKGQRDLKLRPMTSLDWNEDDITMIATSSCDASCTIWDIEKEQPKYQVFGHEREVFDIEFAPGRNIFGSVSADATLCIFDLRNLKHSSVLYKSEERRPLMRLSWNKLNPNYIATFTADSQQALLIDVRKPSSCIATLTEHLGSINAIAWAPHSSMHVCTASDDHHALIWDVSNLPNSVESPILAYAAEKEVNNLKWFYQSSDTNWVAIAFDKKMQLLRV